MTIGEQRGSFKHAQAGITMCYLVFGGPILQLWRERGGRKKNSLHISVGHWILKHALTELMCRDVEIAKTQPLLSGMLHAESIFGTIHFIIPFLFYLFFFFFCFSSVCAITSPLNLRQSQPDVHDTKVWPAANFNLISTLGKRFFALERAANSNASAHNGVERCVCEGGRGVWWKCIRFLLCLIGRIQYVDQRIALGTVQRSSKPFFFLFFFLFLFVLF